MSDKIPETGKSEEVDLGQLFKLIGDVFQRFFDFLGSILNKLFMAFVWLVFFFRKKMLIIGGAFVLGLILGIVHDRLTTPVYVSYVTVKQNYDSGENLYNLIYYYNSLLGQKEQRPLGQIFDTDQEKANSIVGFEVEPTISENLSIRNYNDYVKELDSVLAVDLDYETYIENTRVWDYKYQKVYISSLEPSSMRDVFNGIVEKINNAEFFKNEQKKDLDLLKNQEIALKESLDESEKLRETYKKVLEAQVQPVKTPQTSITIEGPENNVRTREYDLLQNDLVIRKELASIERQKQNREKVIEIVSREFDSGVLDMSIDFFGIETSRKALYALILTFLATALLFGIELMKYLERFNKQA